MKATKYVLLGLLSLAFISCGDTKKDDDEKKSRRRDKVEADDTERNRKKGRKGNSGGLIRGLFGSEEMDTCKVDTVVKAPPVLAELNDEEDISPSYPKPAPVKQAPIKRPIAEATEDNSGNSEEGISIDDVRDKHPSGGTGVPPNEDEIFDVVEQDAEFPGGQTALLKFFSNNLKYPAIAIEQDLQGVVILRFVVERDGSIGEVQVKKSLSPECDAAAVAVVRKLPRFIPAKQRGRPVRKWFTVPVRFTIQ